MGTSRKSQREKVSRRPKGKRDTGADGFQDRLMSLVEWLADKDPVRAARLIGDYLEDLAGELGPTGPRAT